MRSRPSRPEFGSLQEAAPSITVGLKGTLEHIAHQETSILGNFSVSHCPGFPLTLAHKIHDLVWVFFVCLFV